VIILLHNRVYVDFEKFCDLGNCGGLKWPMKNGMYQWAGWQHFNALMRERRKQVATRRVCLSRTRWAAIDFSVRNKRQQWPGDKTRLSHHFFSPDAISR